jgi:ABC-2 type transport system ATP-binding protein
VTPGTACLPDRPVSPGRAHAGRRTDGDVRHQGVPEPAPGALGWGLISRPDVEESAISSAAPRFAPLRVEVSGLSKSFGSVRAVDNLSFTVEPGSVTGFLGPNGAGKTTTLRMLLGLETPDAGQATFDGKRYAELAEPVRTVGAVLETAFHPARSGRNHLRVYCRAAGLPTSRADEVLGQVGLTDAGDRRAGGYSLGMRQRLALATALLGDPPVLVLDEPANGLDPEGIQWLRGFLQHLAHADGRTVLVSSHLLAEMEQTTDRVVIIGAGRLVREGSIAELRVGADGAGTVLARSPEVHRLAEVLRADGHPVQSEDGDSLTVTGIATADVGRYAFGAHIELHELRSLSNGLEDIYFRLTAGQGQFAAHTPVVAAPQEGTR